MCKIMAIAGINPDKVELAWDFLKASVNPMVDYKNTDGAGYAGITAAGEVFGERWINPNDAFKVTEVVSPTEKKLMAKYEKAVVRKVVYDSFGDLTLAPNACSIIFHTRMATSPITIYNTHPFTRDNMALIHNGVIRNIKELELIKSTCDSETILNEYCKNRVDADEGKIQALGYSLEGTYACAVLGTGEDKNTPYLDIFKNSFPGLVVAHIEELGTEVFCTDIETIKRTCDTLKLTISAWFWVMGGKLIRLNAVTGDKISITEFDDEYASAKVHKIKKVVQPSNFTRAGRSTGLKFTTDMDIEAVEERITEEEIRKLIDNHEMDRMKDPFYTDSGS